MELKDQSPTAQGNAEDEFDDSEQLSLALAERRQQADGGDQPIPAKPEPTSVTDEAISKPEAAKTDEQPGDEKRQPKSSDGGETKPEPAANDLEKIESEGLELARRLATDQAQTKRKQPKQAAAKESEPPPMAAPMPEPPVFDVNVPVKIDESVIPRYASDSHQTHDIHSTLASLEEQEDPYLPLFKVLLAKAFAKPVAAPPIPSTPAVKPEAAPVSQASGNADDEDAQQTYYQNLSFEHDLMILAPYAVNIMNHYREHPVESGKTAVHHPIFEWASKKGPGISLMWDNALINRDANTASRVVLAYEADVMKDAAQTTVQRNQQKLNENKAKFAASPSGGHRDRPSGNQVELTPEEEVIAVSRLIKERRGLVSA